MAGLSGYELFITWNCENIANFLQIICLKFLFMQFRSLLFSSLLNKYGVAYVTPPTITSQKIAVTPAFFTLHSLQTYGTMHHASIVASETDCTKNYLLDEVCRTCWGRKLFKLSSYVISRYPCGNNRKLNSQNFLNCLNPN